jgi:hypothetical protein
MQLQFSLQIPMKIESLAGLGVIKVECGSQFSVALTRSGSVYTWWVFSLSLQKVSFIRFLSTKSIKVQKLKLYRLNQPHHQTSFLFWNWHAVMRSYAKKYFCFSFYFTSGECFHFTLMKSSFHSSQRLNHSLLLKNMSICCVLIIFIQLLQCEHQHNIPIVHT